MSQLATTMNTPINARDSTVNVAGRDQTIITNIYNIDPYCNSGIFDQSNLRSKLIVISDKIYQWLSAVIPSTNYHGALNEHLEDTGLWFINGARFAQWKVEADNFLWVCGTRKCFCHLQVIIGSKLPWKLVPARQS
jgi:hypothetical protein